MNSNTQKRQAKIRKAIKADNNRPRKGTLSTSDAKGMAMVVDHNINEQGVKQSFTTFLQHGARPTYRRTFKAMQFDTEGE
jgi:hypothetical protein